MYFGKAALLADPMSEEETEAMLDLLDIDQLDRAERDNRGHLRWLNERGDR